MSGRFHIDISLHSLKSALSGLVLGVVLIALAGGFLLLFDPLAIMYFYKTVLWLILGLAMGLVFSPFARAAKEETQVLTRAFNIPSAEAPQALAQFGEAVDAELIFLLEQVEGVPLNAVRGNYTPREAIHRLVADTELTVVKDPVSGAWIVKSRSEAESEDTTVSEPSTTIDELQNKMKKPKSLSKTLAGLLSLFLLGGSPEVLAQMEGEEDEIQELDQFEVAAEAYEGYVGSVTVSGARTTMNLVNVPQTINIVTRDLIDDTAAGDPLDAMIKTTSGVASFNGGRGGVNAIIRGFRAQNWSVDGATTRYRSSLTTFNYEALEVVKGPSSLLYGPFGAYGGYINMVPKKPKRSPTNTIKVGVGTDSFYEGMVDFGGVFGKDGDWQYRVVAGYQNQDAAGYDHGFKKGYIFAPSLAIDIGDNARLSIRYEYSDIENKFIWGVQDGNGDLVEGFNSQGPRPDYFWSGEVSNWQLVYTNQISEQWALRLNTFFQYEDYQRNFVVPFGGAPSDEYGFRTDRRFANQWTVYSDFTISWELPDLPNGFSNEFVFGAEINHWDLTRWFFALSNQYPQFSGTTFNVINPDWSVLPEIEDLTYSNRDLPYNKEWLGGVFWQESLGLFDDRLTLSLGGRWNYDARSNFRRVREPNTPDGELVPRPGSPDPTNVNQEWTFRYGAVYKPRNNISIYYGHTEAYLPVGAIFTVDGAPLEPETGENDEIGLKVDLVDAFGGTISGNLAYFQLQVNNKWRGDPNNPGFFIQDGLQENNGVEAQVSYTGDKLSAIVGVYTADGPLEPNKDDLRAVHVPDFTFNFWGKYNITDRLSIGGGYRYEGDRLSGNRSITVEPHDNIDLFATYTMPFQDGDLKFRLNVSNVEDEYNVFRINNPSRVFVGETQRVKLSGSYTW